MIPEAELTELLATLERTQTRLRELTHDEVDAVILPSGAAHLLSRAQQDLQQKTNLLSAVMDALPANIALLDRQGNILAVNLAWRRFAEANHADGDQVGMNYLEVCRRDSHAASTLAGLKALLHGETRDVFEVGYPCHSPVERRWFRLLAAPTEGGAVVMHIDVSESWRATEELRRSQRRYQELFDLNPRPVWVTDLERQRFVDVNQAAILHYGYSREEFLALAPTDVQAPESGLGRVSPGIEQHRLKDGSLILVEVYRHILKQEGHPRELVLAIDVSEKIRAELALESSRALLAMASSLSRVGAWNADLTAREVHLSEEYRRFFAPSFVGTMSFDEAFATVHEEDQAFLGEMFERCARDGSPYEEEFRFQTAGGDVLWARIFGEAVRDTTGQVVEVRGATQDITARHQALEELRASEERFRVLAQATDDVIWDWDLVSDEIWWNAKMESVFGHSPEDLDPNISSWKSRIHPQDLPQAWRTIEDLLQSEDQQIAGEYRFRRGDGSYAIVNARGTLIRDEKGRPVRMIGSMADITERRQAEQRLVAQASLIDQATDAIIVHTLKGQILFWSRGAQLLYGWSSAEAEGRSLSELLATDETTLQQRIEEFRRDGEWAGELNKRDRQGNHRTVLARWTLLRDAFGESEAVLAIHTDVTERKGMQKMLQRSQRLESIGTLAGGIAHDLNNVLAPIIMASELLDDEVHSEGGRGLLETLRASSRRGADLVRQILAFARGTGGVRQPIDVRGLVLEVEQLIRETFPRNLAINVAVSEEQLWVQGDPSQLHQVLLNLCVNARDAMPTGGHLSLTLRRVMIDEARAALNPLSVAGPHVRITVEDTGCGIPLEVQDKVMEPFFTTKEIGHGTGLGLSTAFTIVRDHGGLLTFTSEPGRGTLFQLDLPVANAAAPSAEQQPPSVVRGKGEIVLFVDDEAAIRNLARRVLERHGYGVLLATDGSDALAKYTAKTDSIAAVITDMSMPIMDGPALVRALRALDPQLPLIGCSGQGYSGHIQELGFDAYLEKPYEYHLLVGTLREVLDGSQSFETDSSPAGNLPAGRANIIMVVDDDKVLLRLMSRALQAEGHVVITAGDAKTALEILEGHSVDCLLTDVNLPGLSGRELKAQVHKIYPKTPVVLVSGSAREPGMLAKPFTISQLKALVRQNLTEHCPIAVP